MPDNDSRRGASRHPDARSRGYGDSRQSRESASRRAASPSGRTGEAASHQRRTRSQGQASYRQSAQSGYTRAGQSRPSANRRQTSRPTRGTYGTGRTRAYERGGERYSSRNTTVAAKDNPTIKIALIGALVVVGLLAAYFLFFTPKPAHDTSGDVIQGNDAAKPISAAMSNDIVMTLEGDKNTYVLKGEEYLEPGCKATDKSTGSITTNMKIDGSVNTSAPGDYEITYTATMPNGAQGQAKRTVHVVDSFEENATTLPVLMYHYVFTAADSEGKTDANYILDTKLREQVKYLKDNNYYYPSYQEIRAFVEGRHTLPAKSVVLTFDDGELGFLQYGVPIFNELEVPATSFVVCTDAGDNLVTYASEYVQFQSHTYDMHRDGTSVGQGGVIHVMTQQEIYDDIEKSKEILGGTVDAVAYPYGDNNEAAWAALSEAKVPCAFTVKNARISPGDNPLALNRVRISGEYQQEGFEYLVTPNGGEQ